MKGSTGRFGLDLGKMLYTNKDNSALLQKAGQSEDPIQERISVKMVRLLHPGVGWPSVVLSRLFSIFSL